MPRILTGVQSTGVPHLGNLLGAILPAIKWAHACSEPSFLFVADLHSITQIKDSKLLKENTYQVVAAWLACGLDTDRIIFYRQSDVPEVTELAWYLNCFYPYQRLKLAHSFKDKKDYIEDVNSGLFTYPMLMAADILLYDAEKIPVGKDQLQHLEIAREVAQRFNRKMGKVFVLPEAMMLENLLHIPGTDGQKMSKSRKNTINIFAPDKDLRKQIMSIQTDSMPLKAPKDPEKDLVFSFYKLLASEEEIDHMRENYLAGGYGYGQVKQALYEFFLKHFAKEREKFNSFVQDEALLDEILVHGSQRASKVAQQTLKRVRHALGFSANDLN
ncbi:tryptophan--tRNA ligase [Bacteroidetes bacterium endosymbiont of Geopemphigus sp.]|uniref:tryptophan--tRNA ligase n=1 Tax=Bacteroidetes bacterium endosymbiont of Geopemphigus sp. TaxID=2047937 RepID=UPI000CD16CD4|nr:tryptophan--tRNA ligase [Bacteroidetes bacterium endosymbiont of Geopemphigus sp.]